MSEYAVGAAAFLLVIAIMVLMALCDVTRRCATHCATEYGHGYKSEIVVCECE